MECCKQNVIMFQTKFQIECSKQNWFVPNMMNTKTVKRMIKDLREVKISVNDNVKRKIDKCKFDYELVDLYDLQKILEEMV